MSDRDRIRRATRRRAEETGNLRAKRAEQHPVAHLQRLIGNAQVARMLAQRQEEDEDEEQELLQRAPEDEEDIVQTKADPGAEGGPVSDTTASAILGMRGGGAPLDSGLRDQMETAFQTSFADVRVHAGPDANALNRSLTSRAFTTGSDVFLGPSASASDSRLLAHELTHVVQQRSMSGGGRGAMSVGPADDAYEKEADTTAKRILDDQMGAAD